jgi:hypothetical protein
MFIFSAFFCAKNNLALMGINPVPTHEAHPKK